MTDFNASTIPGTLLKERYRLERPLARGAMGDLWVGRDEVLDRQVAIKLIIDELGKSKEAQARFRREARAAARLKSPHVVPIFDHGEDRGRPFIVMELLDGEGLDVRLRALGRLDLGEAVWLCEQVGKGLTVAHEAGVVHRDLKPANLFLARVANEDLVKVLDFGVALLAGFDGRATMTGDLVGSPYYMSPEQAEGMLDLDHRSDLFSFGSILYEALTGVVAFHASSLAGVLDRIRSADADQASTLRPGLTPEMDAFFERALALEVDDRFSSAQEMTESFLDAAVVAPVPLRTGGAITAPQPRVAMDSWERSASVVAMVVDPGDDPSLAVTTGPKRPDQAPMRDEEDPGSEERDGPEVVVHPGMLRAGFRSDVTGPAAPEPARDALSSKLSFGASSAGSLPVVEDGLAKTNVIERSRPAPEAQTRVRPRKDEVTRVMPSEPVSTTATRTNAGVTRALAPTLPLSEVDDAILADEVIPSPPRRLLSFAVAGAFAAVLGVWFFVEQVSDSEPTNAGPANAPASPVTPESPVEVAPPANTNSAMASASATSSPTPSVRSPRWRPTRSSSPKSAPKSKPALKGHQPKRLDLDY